MMLACVSPEDQAAVETRTCLEYASKGSTLDMREREAYRRRMRTCHCGTSRAHCNHIPFIPTVRASTVADVKARYILSMFGEWAFSSFPYSKTVE